MAMWRADHNVPGTLVVEYTVDGRLYTATLNMTTSDMYSGKQITMRSLKDNPQEIRYLEDNGRIIGIRLCMGIVFTGRTRRYIFAPFCIFLRSYA